MWKKGSIGVFGVYVGISLCEWASRLAFGAEHGLLAWAWTMAEPVLLFLYAMGGHLRDWVRLIRLEDGAASFIDTALFCTRLASGAFDVVWGFVGVPFWNFVPHTFPFALHSWPVTVFVLFTGAYLLIALLNFVISKVVKNEPPSAEQDEPATYEAPAAQADPVLPAAPKRAARSRLNKD